MTNQDKYIIISILKDDEIDINSKFFREDNEEICQSLKSLILSVTNEAKTEENDDAKLQAFSYNGKYSCSQVITKTKIVAIFAKFIYDLDKEMQINDNKRGALTKTILKSVILWGWDILKQTSKLENFQRCVALTIMYLSKSKGMISKADIRNFYLKNIENERIICLNDFKCFHKHEGFCNLGKKIVEKTLDDTLKEMWDKKIIEMINDNIYIPALIKINN